MIGDKIEVVFFDKRNGGYIKTFDDGPNSKILMLSLEVGFIVEALGDKFKNIRIFRDYNIQNEVSINDPMPDQYLDNDYFVYVAELK